MENFYANFKKARRLSQIFFRNINYILTICWYTKIVRLVERGVDFAMFSIATKYMAFKRWGDVVPNTQQIKAFAYLKLFGTIKS